MKTPTLVLALALLTACSSPPGDANAPASAAHPETTEESKAPATESGSVESTPVPETTSAVTIAAASGVVESVDTGAKTITIAHGPVEALKWPAMTMTFQAPDADLASIKQGDHVAFEFTSTGMKATITKVVRQQ